ncbi:MAG: sulfotransferase domain-containing protein [Anaerolineales bacterium]
MDWELKRKRGLGHLFRKATLAPWRAWRRSTAFARALPNFLIIGAQKAGTTSLYGYLSQHHNVMSPMKKEIRYFGENYFQGPNWYRAHFPFSFRLANGKMITGESSPTTIFHPLAHEWVAATIPSVKLIALLRDPVARAFSHHQMNLRSGRDQLPFEVAIQREAERLDGALEGVLNGDDEAVFRYTSFSYLARGDYETQLKRWVRVFPKEQLLILQSEELFQNPAQAYRRVLAFLGLSMIELPSYDAFNPGRYDGEIPQKSRSFLTEYFREPNQRLAELLGQDFNWQPAASLVEVL